MKKLPLLEELTDALRQLPGVGPKTAQRFAWHLMQRDRVGAQRLGAALTNAAQNIRHCERCNTLSDSNICATCADPSRDATLLCVIESPADQLSIEQTLAFKGLYFVMMGRLAPLDGIGPNEIAFDALLARATDGVVTEVIIATSFTQEGEATAHYLAQTLRAKGIKSTRLARGVPLGSELEYVDASTIAQALRDRRTTDQ